MSIGNDILPMMSNALAFSPLRAECLLWIFIRAYFGAEYTSELAKSFMESGFFGEEYRGERTDD